MVTGAGSPPPPPRSPAAAGAVRDGGGSGGRAWGCGGVGGGRAMGRRVWLGLLSLWLLAAARPGWALQDVTGQLFGDQAFGTVAAFGDFNSDKQTDIFVLRGGG